MDSPTSPRRPDTQMPDGPRRNQLARGCLVALGALMTVVIGGWLLLVWAVENSLNSPLPHAAAQIAQLRHDDSITKVRPAGGHLVSRTSGGASQSSWPDTQPVPSHVTAAWRLTGTRGAALDSLVRPALHDGWTMTLVGCDRQAGTSTISFLKPSGTGGFEEDLRIEVDRFDGLLTVEVTTPLDFTTSTPPVGGWPAVSSLWHTGVLRTDPGCLDGAPATTTPHGGLQTFPGNISGDQLCAVLVAAWPEATNVDPEGAFCDLNVDGYQFELRAVPLSSQASYEGQRLDPEGNDTRFPLYPGGFWVALPYEAVASDPGIDAASQLHAGTEIPPAVELSLAARLQAAHPA